MGAKTLSSRAIIGGFYKRLEQGAANWPFQVGMMFQSDQASETYNWLGQSPAMREWVGGRLAKALRENGITISNKDYEATLRIEKKDITRDKTGQVMARVNELADRANSHWASLLSTLIINAESTVCYDGQFFFDTDHTEGDNTTNQSNDLSIDISALPVTNHGSTTAPSVGEMQQVVLQMVQQILGFKDDQNEPMNENARNFMVMVPTALWNVAHSALSMPMIDNGESNVLTNLGGYKIVPVANPRLTWTDKVSMYRTDGNVKPFILQSEEDVIMKAKGDGSEFEFDHKAHEYGISASRNVGYGYWQHACLAQMT